MPHTGENSLAIQDLFHLSGVAVPPSALVAMNGALAGYGTSYIGSGSSSDSSSSAVSGSGSGGSAGGGREGGGGHFTRLAINLKGITTANIEAVKMVLTHYLGPYVAKGISMRSECYVCVCVCVGVGVCVCVPRPPFLPPPPPPPQLPPFFSHPRQFPTPPITITLLLTPRLHHTTHLLYTIHYNTEVPP
jgi:hypothetical protein